MKGEEQILELLAEVLRKQDQAQQTIQEINSRLTNVEVKLDNVEVRLDNVDVRLGNVEVRLGNVEVRLGNVEENQLAHQHILRTLALGQQKHQQELEDIIGILDSVARMQRDTNRRLDRLEHPGDFA